MIPGAAMIAVTFGLARYGYGLLLPDMRDELSLSSGTAGLIASGTYASYLVANIAVVQVITRWGPRLAIALATAAAAGGMIMISVASNAAVLAAGVLIAGAAAGLAFPPYSELVATRVESGRQEVVWSAISSGTGWGVAVAGPIAILAGDHWRLAWMIFVGLAVVVGAVATLLAPRHSGRAARRPQLSVSWFLCPRSRPLLLSAVFVGLGSAVWWSFSVDALRDAGTDPTMARIVYAICGAAGIVASVSGSAFARWGLRRGHLVTCAVLAVSLALLGFAAGQLPVAIMAAVLFGVCYNGVVAAQGIWSSRVFEDHPAAGLAAVNTALTIGTLIGPTLAGVAIGWFGFGPTLAVAALVIAASLPYCPPSPRRREVLAAHRSECRATPVAPAER
jgi:predicted MFS family arabinose efflux permease